MLRSDEREAAPEPARLSWRAPALFWLAGMAALVAGATSSIAIGVCVAFPLMWLAVLAPIWASRSTQRFDRDLPGLLAARDQSAAFARLRGALGMQLFAAPHVTAERAGRLALELAAPRRARRAVSRALSAWSDEDAAPLSLRIGYAHACFEHGDDTEAIWIYRDLMSKETLPRVGVRLAHALWRSGAGVREVLAVVAQSAPHADEAERADLLLVQALAESARGHRATARELFDEVQEPKADPALYARAKRLLRVSERASERTAERAPERSNVVSLAEARARLRAS